MGPYQKDSRNPSRNPFYKKALRTFPGLGFLDEIVACRFCRISYSVQAESLVSKTRALL